MIIKRGIKETKYKSHRCEHNGIKFASKAEMSRYVNLEILARDGAISELEIQPRFVLLDKFKSCGNSYRAIEYVADFRYRDINNTTVVEDVKGKETPVYKLKIKLFLHRRDAGDFGERIVFREMRLKNKKWSEVDL